MPYRNLTIDELASQIGMDAREVRRLAEKGELPGQLVGGEWRFNRAQMQDWLQQQMHSLDQPDIRRLEQATSVEPDQPFLAALLRPEAVEVELRAKSKASVLRELVTLAERTGLVYDRAALIEALEERESVGSTGLSEGVAMPHPRRPLPWATAEPLLCVARVPAGVHFAAPDHRLTDLFFLVCSHDERHHLHVLARLSQLLKTDLPGAIREAEDGRQARRVLLEAERALLSTRG